MKHITSGLILVVLLPAALRAADDFPPLPDFKKRVDYVSWYEKAAKTNRKGNAYKTYAKFMPALVNGSAEDDWPEFGGMLRDVGARRMAGLHGGQGPKWPGPAPWHPKRQPRWEHAYKLTKKVLKQYATASAKGKLSAPTGMNGKADTKQDRLISLKMPHLQAIRDCSRGTLEAAWRVGKKSGRPSVKRFMKAVATNLRVANQLSESMFSIEQLVACTIRRTTYRQIRWAFAHGVLQEKHAKDLAEILDDVDEDSIDVSQALRGECAIWLDALQYVFGPLGGGTKLNGNRYREVTGQSMGPRNRFGLGARLESDPSGAAKAILDAHKEMFDHMSEPFTQEHHHAIAAIAERLRHSSKVNEGLMLGLGANYAHIYQTAAQCETDRRATRLLVQLYAYKAKSKKGKWPSKLSKLGKNAQAYRDDVFAKGDFQYMRLDGEPVVYSAGPDGEDDGGAHAENWAHGSDYVYWPIPDSAERIRSSELNCVPEAKLTALAKIGKKLADKKVTVAGLIETISSQPHNELGRKYEVKLSQDTHEVLLVYYAEVDDALSDNQKLEEGLRIRAVATVEEIDGKWKLHLKRATDMAIEE